MLACRMVDSAFSTIQWYRRSFLRSLVRSNNELTQERPGPVDSVSDQWDPQSQFSVSLCLCSITISTFSMANYLSNAIDLSFTEELNQGEPSSRDFQHPKYAPYSRSLISLVKKRRLVADHLVHLSMFSRMIPFSSYSFIVGQSF